MARNGSGTYVLPAGNPVTTGTTISSTWANTTLSDIGSALTTSISNDGQTVPTANLPMGGFAHTGVANASVRTQYASAAQVQDGALTYLGAISGTNTITGSAAVGMTAYTIGQIFTFISVGANTGAVTLNINGIGAKNIYKNGTLPLVNGDIASGAALHVVYDGTQFQLISAANASFISYEQGASVTAGNFIIGQTYLITSIGTTNFLSIGAVSNTVGIYFTATGIGSGTGTAKITRSVQAKLQESVSVIDFGADPTGVVDSTTAFTNAQTASKNVKIPPGSYLIDNLRIQTGVNLLGSGHINTILIQKSAGNPAINCTSDVTSGQLNGLVLKDFSITGATSATVTAFLIAAHGAYAIGDSIFDFRVTNSYRALEVQAADANNLVGSTISVVSSNTSSTSVVINGGVYNKYNLYMTGCASGLALTAFSWNTLYSQVVADGELFFNGQEDLILSPTIEQFSSATVPNTSAITLQGFRQTLISPTLILNSTNSAKVTYGISTFGQTTLISPQWLCTIANPLYLQSGNYATIIGPVTSTCTNKVESIFDPRLTTFIGDCSQITTSNTPRAGRNIQYTAPTNVVWGIPTLSNTDTFVVESSVGTLTTLNLAMPVAYNNQTFTVSSTTAITTIVPTAGTVGDIVTLVPTTLAAGASFTMVYRAANTKWYKS